MLVYSYESSKWAQKSSREQELGFLDRLHFSCHRFIFLPLTLWAHVCEGWRQVLRCLISNSTNFPTLVE